MKPRTLELDDFGRRDTDGISEVVRDALIDLGYGTVSAFSWSIKVEFISEPSDDLGNVVTAPPEQTGGP